MESQVRSSVYPPYFVYSVATVVVPTNLSVLDPFSSCASLCAMLPLHVKAN